MIGIYNDNDIALVVRTSVSMWATGNRLESTLALDYQMVNNSRRPPSSYTGTGKVVMWGLKKKRTEQRLSEGREGETEGIGRQVGPPSPAREKIPATGQSTSSKCE